MIARSWLFLVGPAVLLLSPQLSNPADNSVQFTGSLEAVTHHTVSIRLADGRIVDARIPDGAELSAQSLFLKYRMGDVVQIKGHVVPVAGNERDGYFPLVDEETGIGRNLDLEQISLVRTPSSDELANALSSRSRMVKGNLLADPTRPGETPDVSLKTLTRPAINGPSGKQGADAVLERTRTLVHQYLAALPNFVADSTTTLYRSPKAATPKWTVIESLRAEAHFRGGREVLMNIVRNGVALPDDATLPAALRARASTTTLSEVFNPDCPVTIDFEKRTVDTSNTPLLVYRFASPRDSCFGSNWDGNYERYFAPREGEVFVGEADGLVREISCITTGFPPEFAHSRFEERVKWDEVRIGDERHFLPVSSETLMFTRGGFSWSVAEYANHRHFETSSSITFH